MPELLLLFASAFTAATILPFPSEVTLAGLLQLGQVEPAALWLVATIGNTLGSMVNWVLGRFALHFQHHPRFPVLPTRLARAQRWFGRFGVWTLLLAWLPVVGDPLTLVAGIMRTPLLLTLVLVAIGKGARYAAVIGLAG